MHFVFLLFGSEKNIIAPQQIIL